MVTEGVNAVPRRHSGQIAVVTGGSNGIGRAAAVRLAHEGADVAITWHRDRHAADAALREISAAGSQGHAVRAALGPESAVLEVVDEVRCSLGEPTLLLSSAATGAWGPLRTSTARQWSRVMETNAAALLRLCQAARQLRSVVALSSIGARRVQPGYGLVAVSKAAIETLVRYLAVELAPAVRVNAIAAGPVDTRSVRELLPQASEKLDNARIATPAGRLVTTEDVASVASFLLSEEAAMVVGQTLTVDGGVSLCFAG